MNSIKKNFKQNNNVQPKNKCQFLHTWILKIRLHVWYIFSICSLFLHGEGLTLSLLDCTVICIREKHWLLINSCTFFFLFHNKDLGVKSENHKSRNGLNKLINSYLFKKLFHIFLHAQNITLHPVLQTNSCHLLFSKAKCKLKRT